MRSSRTNRNRILTAAAGLALILALSGCSSLRIVGTLTIDPEFASVTVADQADEETPNNDLLSTP